MTLINWRIASNPLNWVTLGLMVLIAAVGLHIVMQAASQKGTN